MKNDKWMTTNACNIWQKQHIILPSCYRQVCSSIATAESVFSTGTFDIGKVHQLHVQHLHLPHLVFFATFKSYVPKEQFPTLASCWLCHCGSLNYAYVSLCMLCQIISDVLKVAAYKPWHVLKTVVSYGLSTIWTTYCYALLDKGYGKPNLGLVCGVLVGQVLRNWTIHPWLFDTSHTTVTTLCHPIACLIS